MRHGLVCGLAAALLCACQPSGGAKAQPSGSAVPISAQPASKQIPLSLQELSRIVGATCEDPQAGKGCSEGDYDIVLRPTCDQDGLFARVRDSSGALLIDKAPPEDTVRRAILAKGQPVCIEAIARAGEADSYYYVVTIPSPRIASCKAGDLCRDGKSDDIHWLIPHVESLCQKAGRGRFLGGCAAGWVRATNLTVVGQL